jgi:hypothetical protein
MTRTITGRKIKTAIFVQTAPTTIPLWKWDARPSDIRNAKRYLENDHRGNGEVILVPQIGPVVKMTLDDIRSVIRFTPEVPRA